MNSGTSQRLSVGLRSGLCGGLMNLVIVNLKYVHGVLQHGCLLFDVIKHARNILINAIMSQSLNLMHLLL